jgi:alpha-N-arabinofuranosidase
MTNTQRIKSALLSLFILFPAGWGTAAESTNYLILNANEELGTINKNIYGHFVEHLGGCIYGGIWVGEDSTIPNTRGIRNDVVEALKKIEVPVLRWPGGCFADEYHWKDGIGPREERPPMVNTHWGMVVENNHFGTHEFMDLCEQLGTEPYICGNVGSGTVREMQEWVEYMTFDGDTPMANLRRQNGREEPWKVKYWGVGNENWGCGGNMTPEFYADLYRQFATYLRNFSGNRLFKIAGGSNSDRLDWTEVLMQKGTRFMDGLSLHYYCGTGRKSRSATQYDEEDWFHLLNSAYDMDRILEAHTSIMDRYDPRKRIGLMVDEWGAWHAVEPGTNPGFLYQQNSLRDALVAALTLNIFNHYNDRVQMANIAQMVNVLQAMVLTDEEKMLLTPTYHVFEMYKDHQDATRLHTFLQCGNYAFGNERMPAMNASASRDENGTIHITLCHFDPNQSAELKCEVNGMEINSISGRVLTADEITAHNTFDDPERVKPAEFDDFEEIEGGFTVTVPAKSVLVLEID